MKKTKLTRSLLAACSIVALTAVMYGCVDSGDGTEPEPRLDATGGGVRRLPSRRPRTLQQAEAAAEQPAAALQTLINGLRMQLGLEADEDLGDAIADLQAASAAVAGCIAGSHRRR